MHGTTNLKLWSMWNWNFRWACKRG